MGLPFVVLNMVSAVLFKDLGISDAQIAFWTSLIMWPWTIKFLWSPFLEIFRTKKYKVPRGRRPRLTADQKAANNISRRLRSRFLRPNSIWKSPRQGRCPGLRFRKISRYFPLWNQICDFWFGGPGKNRYL